MKLHNACITVKDQRICILCFVLENEKYLSGQTCDENDKKVSNWLNIYQWTPESASTILDILLD
jgi:hypothetical protein